MTNTCTIRHALSDDAPVVYGFICDLEESSFDEELFRTYFTANCTSVDIIYLVTVSGTEVVGFLSCHSQILLHHLGRVYEIQEMYVHSEYRSGEIGKQLLDYLEAELSNVQYEVLEVTSNVKRTDTHRFYLRNGFRQTHSKFTKAKS